MPQPVISQTRTQIREQIGRNLGSDIFQLVEATSTIDTASLIATYSLAKGGDNEYSGRQVVLVTKVGSIVLGEKSWISSFSAATFDATVAPVFTASITDGDIFEMWQGVTYEEINDAIDRAIMRIADDALQTHQIVTVVTQESILEYGLDSSYKALLGIDYVKRTGIDHLIEDCDAVWSELVDGDVTATADTAIKKEGNASLKLVVAAGTGAGDILATEAIGELDLSDSDTLEVWIYSTVALDAGDIQVLLDDTAQCASPVESLDVPATTAATWTRHLISLANPASDTAVISVGIKMVTDKGAFTLYVDDIRAVLAGSREFVELHRDHWDVVRDSTNKLRFTPTGLGLVGTNTLLRQNGLKLPSLMTADTSTSEVDPEWVIEQVTADLLRSNALASQLDIEARRLKADDHQKIADGMKPSVTTKFSVVPRWV
ncbi:hypothetical protein LCGC14_2022420 [marine sediment metagenome]|uniref:Uncharacterized protein n=1 Tax=marine sediment metagenome TaxID=412755 RepID=A0A0F9HAE2_9ZZZZ